MTKDEALAEADRDISIAKQVLATHVRANEKLIEQLKTDMEQLRLLERARAQEVHELQAQLEQSKKDFQYVAERALHRYETIKQLKQRLAGAIDALTSALED